jgi:hypothetical protein
MLVNKRATLHLNATQQRAAFRITILVLKFEVAESEYIKIQNDEFNMANRNLRIQLFIQILIRHFEF